MKKSDLEAEHKLIISSPIDEESVLSESTCPYAVGVLIPVDHYDIDEHYIAFRCARRSGHEGNCACDPHSGDLLIEWESGHMLCEGCGQVFPEAELLNLDGEYGCQGCADFDGNRQMASRRMGMKIDSKGFVAAPEPE